jgi:hypothetical protein
VVALTGCGGLPVSTSAPPASSYANLDGNWLLTGQLPFAGLGSSGIITNTQFGVAGTFSVVGSTVVAALSANLPCGAFTASDALGVMTGTVASDGSFTLQNANTVSVGTVTLSGTVPSSATSSWSGNLAVSLAGAGCPGIGQTSFTAVKIADVTGTYSGSSTITFANATPSAQVLSFQIALQQGAALTASGTDFPEVLTGTVKVQGSPCFSSGTIVAPTGGGVLGSKVVINATMNDGSVLTSVGDILDTGAMQIEMSNLIGSGGSCGLFSTQAFTLSK